MRRLHWCLVILAATAGCGGGGSSGDGGSLPTPVVPLSDAEATEAASGAVLTITAALVALASEPPGVAVPNAAARASGPAGRAVLCANGGVLVARCSGSVITSTAHECELIDDASGTGITVDGRLSVAVGARGVCRTGEIPLDAVRTYRFTHFQAVVRDAGAVVETFAAPRLVQTVRPLAGGCAAGQAEHRLDGRLLIRRRDGTDLRVDMRALRLGLHLDGTPCAPRVTADGRAEIADHAAGRFVRAAFAGLTVSGSAAIGYRIDGAAMLDCLGAFSVATEAPLVLAAPCADAGALRFQLPSRATARSRFDAGGILLDADGDGAPERSVDSCIDTSLASCE